jgi:DNA (cytosine-5)-methyltransferase 1
MWDVCRFAEYHNYEAIILENVVEAKTRWPLFDVWLTAMHTLGYHHKCVYLNSMHCHPTPQSRDRMYVVFWKKGNKAPDLDITPLAHCPKCCKDVHAIQTWKHPLKRFGKYNKQYVYCCPNDGAIVEPYYYAAFNIIDWSDQGKRIGDRPKDLSPVTKKRVLHGLAKYKDEPFFLHAAYSDHARGVVRPMVRPLFTQTTLSSQALVVPPFIIKGGQTSQPGYAKSVGEALYTQETWQNMAVVSDESFKSFLASYNTTGHSTSYFTQSTGTITTTDRLALINYKTPKYEDCYYRMLKAREVKLGMAFDDEYKICGSPKEQVMQCGNAVTPPAMELLMERVVNSLK